MNGNVWTVFLKTGWSSNSCAIVLYVAFPVGALKSDRKGCEAEQRVSAGSLVSGTSGNQVP